MSEHTYCITIGDPLGIGPEITAKLLARLLRDDNSRLNQNYIVIGHLQTLEKTAASLGITLDRESDGIDYIDIRGNIEKEAGTLSYMALDKAVELIHAGKAKALVTGPISKEHLIRSGINYSGHTEILEALSRSYFRQACQADMMFFHQAFRMLLLTRHVPLRQVSRALTLEGVTRSLESLVRFLIENQRIDHPRIGLMGVNPHAGEIGGEEERNILIPAAQDIVKRYDAKIHEPFPADALFRGFSLENIPFDAYVAAYHDQGLIPFKMVAGFQAVNVTIGLPFLRTSVSHGTAQGIAGHGVADPSSLIEALKLAHELTMNHREVFAKPEPAPVQELSSQGAYPRPDRIKNLLWNV